MMQRILLLTLLAVLILGLPASFSWGSQGDKNYLPPVINQNNPRRCQSAWAIATTNTLSARINIAMAKMKFASPLIALSPQSLLQCDNFDHGCLGGEPAQALRWILLNNLTDSTCNPYKARGQTNGLSCSSLSRCQSCWLANTCKSQIGAKVYSFDQLSVHAGEEDIANQILNNGPLVCGITASASFKTYSGGVLKNVSNDLNHNHYVVVYGWGEEKGDKYWIVQNSFGPTWGEEGSARILRGSNYLGVESSCYGVKPVDTWSKNVVNSTFGTIISLPREPLPITAQLTPSQNQLNPNYCDASWAFAVAHALADAELIRSGGKVVRSLSVQALLNCGVGNCEKGGNPHDALTFINKYGLPEQGCQQYQALTPDHESCSAVNNCASCSGSSIFTQNCSDVKNYKRWKIYNYGAVSGSTNMSMQLLNHHTLICGLYASQPFKAYTGGILSQTTVYPKINHWVQIVGEGSDYWIGRNSWGTAWGLGGFFKIKKRSDNLGIQTKCYWAGDLS